MIKDLKKYEARLGFRISFMGRSRRLLSLTLIVLNFSE